MPGFLGTQEARLHAILNDLMEMYRDVEAERADGGPNLGRLVGVKAATTDMIKCVRKAEIALLHWREGAVADHKTERIAAGIARRPNTILCEGTVQ